MRSLPSFQAETTELLNNVDLARRLWQADAQGLFFEDWKKFADWLKFELRSRARSLRDWSTPYVYYDESVSVNIEADAWKSEISLYFELYPQSFTEDDTIENYSIPNVGLAVEGEWPHRQKFFEFIAGHRPEGFVSTYSDGSPDIYCPFWRDLPLSKFRKNGVFDMEGFVHAIVEAFESLVAIRPAIDRFLVKLPKVEEPVVPLVGKALILDLEGLEEVVEVGLILVAYNPQTFELAGILDTYGGLRDPGPGAKLPPSNFTRKMLVGKKLLKEKVESFIGQADTIIAHNACALDKPLFQKLFPHSKSPRWLCSRYGLPWENFGFKQASLEYLCKHHGIRNRNAHRALPDAEALLELLAQKRGSASYFSELLRGSKGGSTNGTSGIH